MGELGAAIDAEQRWAPRYPRPWDRTRRRIWRERKTPAKIGWSETQDAMVELSIA